MWNWHLCLKYVIGAYEAMVDNAKVTTYAEMHRFKMCNIYHLTMRFSMMKLFWAISCISSFSEKTFFSARKDVMVLKAALNHCFQNLFFLLHCGNICMRLSCFAFSTFLMRQVTDLSPLFGFVLCRDNLHLYKWKLSPVIPEAFRFNGYQARA